MAPETSGTSVIRHVENVKTINDVDVYSCVRHVSVQTGEEFSPEFLRERKPRLDVQSEESFPTYNQNLQVVYENTTSSVKRDSEYSNKGFPVEVEKNAYPVSSVPDCSFSGKLKFLCSFGGKILPRPSDRKLRYVGGDTRIISIKKNLTYQELLKKTFSIWNQPHLIKYQLPDEDLDALISVCSNDDMQHMIEEYHELEKKSQRLRVFLASLNDPESPSSYDSRSVDQSEPSSNYEYVVAVNGITHLSFSKCSSKENLDKSNMVFSPINNVASSSNLTIFQMSPGDLLTSDVQSVPPGMPVQLTELTNTKVFVESGCENRPDLNKQYIVWKEDMITWTETNDSSNPQENLTSDLTVAENDYILNTNFNENNSRTNVVEILHSAILTPISTDISLVESFEDNLIDNSLSLTSDDKNVDDVTELPEFVENVTDNFTLGIPSSMKVVTYLQEELNPVSAAKTNNERVNDEFISGTAIAEVEAGLHGLQIVKNADLEELRELGSGTFGTVYHGKWRGTDVAIKRIRKSCFSGKSSEQERLTKDFWREALMLSNLHHPNVVALYGVVPDGPGGTLSTVTEYMTNGSLRHVLLKNSRVLDWRKKLVIAQDAAIGMEYLHLKKIIHFDLKCENLLVTMGDPQRPICKVGDFGLSRIKRNTFVSGGVRGTLPWMAPELLNGSSTRVSEKVDVFSFGIVMWEILTEDEPYADMHCGAIIGGIVSNMLRPPIPENCDRRWKDLMEECWSHDPAERPIFTEITNKLRAMLTSLHSKRNNNAKDDMLKV